MELQAVAPAGVREQRISDGEDGVRVILPVLRRPLRVAPVLSSLLDSQQQVSLRPLFMLSPDDERELEAVLATGADYAVLAEPRACGDYARKINVGAALTHEPWVLTAADDVHFHPGWADRAIAFANERGLRAVGVNDLGRWVTRREMPSTHFLVARSYVAEGTIDEPNAIFHTGYDHTYVDNEFMATARARGTYGYCQEAVVEHLHPFWRKGRRDEVYELGRAQMHVDRKLFQQRSVLWT